jgi:hypothetical protein
MDNVHSIKPSNLDQYQMDNATFDVEKAAWRVSIVDGIKVENLHITGELGSSKVEIIKVPEIITKTEIKEISIPTIISEVHTRVEKIEVPVIVKEYERVDVPVVSTEVRIIEIEKPVIIKELELKEIPLVIKACIVLQAISTLGMLLTTILKG